jgi:hypothetical protein
MSDQPSDQTSRGEKMILLGVVVPITAIAIFVWYFDPAYFIPHVATTRVHATNWRAGEYQNCEVTNEKSNEQEPELICSDHESEEPETLRVRFYGRTYDPSQPGPADFFIWRCRKNEGIDPSITCDHEKIGKIPLFPQTRNNSRHPRS